MKRGRLARIFSYLCHYGIFATAALAFEKLFTDKRRFSLKNAAKNAVFPSARGKIARKDAKKQKSRQEKTDEQDPKVLL